MAVLRAYRAFDALTGERRFAFARERFLGAKTLQAIGALKRQLLEALSRAGVVRAGLRAAAIEALGRRTGGDGVRDALGLPPNAPPADDAVVISLLC